MRFRRPVACWFFLIGLLVAAMPVAAQERQLGGVGITVFADANLRGKSATFREDVPDLNRFGLNDSISSFSVAAGERWEACENANYKGRCVVVSGQELDLRKTGWGDTISSLRRVRGGGAYPPNPPRPPGQGNAYVVLYDQPMYRGNPVNFDGAVQNLGRYNDRAQSVTIGRGRWEFCEDANFRGRCVTLDKSAPDLRVLGMEGRISSVRPAGSSGQPGGSAYIVLYDQPTYRGNPVNYDGAMPNLGRFNDRAQSVTIGRGVWELCEDANFGGRCVTLNRSSPDLRAEGLQGRVSSVRPVRPQAR